MILREKINKYSKYLSILQMRITKLDRKGKILAATGVLCLLISGTVLLSATGTQVYSVILAGEHAGYMGKTSAISKVISSIEEDLSSDHNDVIVSLDKKIIAVKATDLQEEEVSLLSIDDFKKKLIASEACTIDGWSIRINGEIMAATTTEKEATQIFIGLKEAYLNDNSQLIKASFQEEILIQNERVNLADLLETEEAVRRITTEPMVGSKPVVTMETVEFAVASESIPYQTVYKESDRLSRGEEQLQVAGVNGIRKVSLKITKVNGVITGEKVLDAEIKTEPTAQIVLTGAQPSSFIIASRGNGRTTAIDASGNEISEFARQFIGVPYVSGGSTPKGFDCSGFTQYIMNHFGVSLPRTSQAQFGIGVSIEQSALKPGDLVFYKSRSDASRIGHVGIYVGGNQFIHAPQPGEQVKIGNLSDSWRVKLYVGSRRVIE